MKWLFFKHWSPDIGGYFTPFKNYYERNKHANMQRRAWAVAMEADVISDYELAKGAASNYDAVLVEYVNNQDSKKRPTGLLRTKLVKEANPDIIVVGIWDAWNPRPRELLSVDQGWRHEAVELCDLIITVENAWEAKDSGREMVWNDVYKTDKFYCILSPINFDHVSSFEKPYGTREKHIISCSPVNYHMTNRNSAEVLKGFMKPPWRAGLTHIRKRRVPEPFYKLGDVAWEEFLDWISRSYMGVFNAVGGGLGSIAAYGAAMKTPFVGSDTADCLANCFPDLALDYKNHGGQANLCRRLIKNPDFWREMTEKGYKICKEEFTFETTKRKLHELLKKRDVI